MKSYEWFVFFLCLFIFTGLILFLGVLIYQIFNLTKKTIVGGLEDENIIKEKEREKEKKENKFLNFIEKTISIIVLLVVSVSFLFSMSIKLMEDITPNGISTIQVVLSDSMSYKNNKNLYLKENNLDNQFNRFDMVTIHKLPDEFDLKLYDIVVYEHENGILIIHRIVGIEEPNSNHPDCRFFLVKGDANSFNDNFPVKYEQMVGIYEGEKIENIGSFVVFLQSPAGWLCVIFVVFMIFLVPYVEEKIQYEKDKRYRIITNDFSYEKDQKNKIRRIILKLIKKLEENQDNNESSTDLKLKRIILRQK